MSILGIDDLKGKLKSGGARPNLFKVGLTLPPAVNGISGTNLNEQSKFLIKAATLPQSSMGVIPIPFRGRQLKIAGDRVFDPWMVTVMNDTGFSIRDELEIWMNAINRHKLNEGLTDPSSYMANLTVEQLDRDGSTLKEYKMVSAFPTDLSEIAVSFDATDTIEEYTVTFQYQYWESLAGVNGATTS